VPGVPIAEGAVAYPGDDRLVCRQCGTSIDVQHVKAQMQERVGRAIVQG
jgi:hypothetical protein